MTPEPILDVGGRAGSEHRHLHVIRKSGPPPPISPQAGHGQEAPPRLELTAELAASLLSARYPRSAAHGP